MRSIKFRAWDKKHEAFSPPYRILLREDGEVFYEGDPGTGMERLDEDRVEIQFFTGLLDKNGKEIYEGTSLNGVTRMRAGTRQCEQKNRYT